MNSYTSTQGNPHFNWWDFFKKASDFKLTEEEITYAVSRASGWDTCAVSEQCDQIPRHRMSGMPMDINLSNLGMKFMKEVRSGLFFTAEKTLAQIELRSAKVILISMKSTND